jgi:tRNA pseudouridine38-40 synthase
VPRYKLTLAYDGTDFCGWQKQEPFDQPTIGEGSSALALSVVGTIHHEGEDRPRVQLRSVQQIVERAVREVVREPVQLIGASRTDAGVHALGQVAAFSCQPRSEELAPAAEDDPSVPRGIGWPLSRGADRLCRAINGRLPDDVQVLACEPVHHDFDPIRHPESKGYSYTLLECPRGADTHAPRALWDRRYVHEVWEKLDMDAMNAAAARIVGEHDFAAFAAAGHGRLSTIRTVFACGVREQPPPANALPGQGRRLRIEVSGNGFLYNMVRIIAGTLVEVGRGRLTPDDVAAAIEAQDRTQAGPTLPPTGLCLEWIKYPATTP